MKVLPFIANYRRELRMGGYKKERKSKKCNGVCGKDEESTWGSRGGIEENIGRYKEAGR